jgi:hypothetical protein
MDELSQWLKNNDTYLAKSLAWLRLLLARLAEQHEAARPARFAASAPSPPAEATHNWHFWERSHLNHPSTGRALLPPAPEGLATCMVSAEQIASAAAEVSAAEATSPPPALLILRSRFGLSRFEQEILVLCASMELDTRIAALCARAQDDPNRPYATFALAMALFEDAAWDALSPEGPLRRCRLIEINQPGAQPLVTSALGADERIVSFLKGLNYLDDRLAPLLFPVMFDGMDAALPPSQQDAVTTILRQLRQSGAHQQVPVIQLAGADAPSKQMIALRAASELGLRLYRLPAESLPVHAGELETLARLVEREIALLPFAIYLDVRELEKSPGEGQPPPLNRFLSRTGGVCFLDTQEIRQGFSRPSITLDVTRPTQAEQQAAWGERLGQNAADVPSALAAQFDLNLPAIHLIARTALAEEVSAEAPLQQRLWNACMLSVRPRLDALAQRIEPKATWNDIVLPETELSLLRQIAAQVRQRGRVYLDWGFAATRTRGLSINALFTGESGTGKTMAAEVIANELRLDLYRIDLSAVVNKYIGETEKNLRRVFDAAETGGVILFFDEADALFGKRSEVKDSHDRYANIEINYLLQRLESYRGLAILATNMRTALDTAFMRRIRFIVEFRPHGFAERKAIWRQIFPPQTRVLKLDYERLATLNLNGGSINNVAINAAFLAAQNNGPVTMPLILDAARTEFLKLKRPIDDADFQWEERVEAVA